MNFQVYHAKDFPKPGQRVFPQDYELVAEVEANNIGDVFYFTNHVDHAWWEHQNVRKVVGRPCRSTSVGDIVVSNEIVSLCRVVGWSDLGNLAQSPFTINAGLLDVEEDDGQEKPAEMG